MNSPFFKNLPLFFLAKLKFSSFLIIFLFFSFWLGAQEKPRIFFNNKADTISAKIGTDYTLEVKLNAPQQKKFHGFYAEIEVESDALYGVDDNNVYLPVNKKVVIDSSKAQNKIFKLKFRVNEKYDKVIKLGLKGYTDKNEPTDLDDYNLTKTILIDPHNDSLSSTKNYEFWLFTGSNIDLLDGPKFKELYFRGSFLLNLLKGKENTNSWVFLNFGKNRYFDNKDTIDRVSFSEALDLTSNVDTIRVARGTYSTIKETLTDNIFFSLDYLQKIESLSSQTSNLFFRIGLSIDLQDIKVSYRNNKITQVDTMRIPRPNERFQTLPIQKSMDFEQFNTSLGIGFFHILNTKEINIKSGIEAGYNSLTYPYYSRSNGITEIELFQSSKSIYTKLQIDAVVRNPGISIGFETFLRRSQVPLFNVSLTKVFDIKQLGGLFGTLPTATE